MPPLGLDCVVGISCSWVRFICWSWWWLVFNPLYAFYRVIALSVIAFGGFERSGFYLDMLTLHNLMSMFVSLCCNYTLVTHGLACNRV